MVASSLTSFSLYIRLILSLIIIFNLRTEKPVSTRHVILVACLMPYEDVPVFESNNYRGLKFDEILQSLQKVYKLTLLDMSY